MTKPRSARFVASIKFHLFVFWNIAFGVSIATRPDPLFPIAVIDNFDVTIIRNFWHEIYLRFSALGGMPGRTSWLLKSPTRYLTVLE